MQPGFFVLVVVFLSLLVAQLLKLWFHEGTLGEPWYWKAGGMPSSHTAPSTALALGVFLVQGFSVLFVVTLVFLVAIIRDAVGVRYATGVNGQVLRDYLGKNVLAKKVIVEQGHTLLQVGAGVLVGLAVTLVTYRVIL